jgi:hypothetical protein
LSKSLTKLFQVSNFYYNIVIQLVLRYNHANGSSGDRLTCRCGTNPKTRSYMTGTGIFLDYHGRIDSMVIDSLLKELKLNREFQSLFITTRKRTYSLIVECLENICRYSALRSAENAAQQPYIQARNTKDTVEISAGNPVEKVKKDKLKAKLDKINSMDDAELRRQHEKRISMNHITEENGAGIGLICIAFKAGNKLKYDFRPLEPEYLLFELKISLNK